MKNPAICRLAWGAALVAALALPFGVAAQKVKDIPLEISLADETGSGEARVRSDGFGAYVHGVDGVTATLGVGDAGAAYFETNAYGKAPIRLIELDFRGLDADGLGVALVDIYSYLKQLTMGDTHLRNLRYGDSGSRTFYMQWPRSAQQSGYRLEWFPTSAPGGVITVTCSDPTAAAGTAVPCKEWTANPVGQATLRKLVGVKKGQFQFVTVGAYDIPFQMIIRAR